MPCRGRLPAGLRRCYAGAGKPGKSEVLSAEIAASLPASRPLRLPQRAAAFAVATLVAALSLIPLGFIAWVALAAGWEQVRTLVFRPRVAELLINTIWLEAITLPAAAVLGVGLAWITERTALPASRWWSALMVAPLAIPAGSACVLPGTAFTGTAGTVRTVLPGVVIEGDKLQKNADIGVPQERSVDFRLERGVLRLEVEQGYFHGRAWQVNRCGPCGRRCLRCARCHPRRGSRRIALR